MSEMTLQNGYKINYEVIGKGKPVLFLHGFTNYGLAWFPQITPLVYNGYQVILPDFPGHGQSSPLKEDYTVKQLADSMIELLDHLNIDKVVACGLSLGGMVTQQLALDHSDRLEGIVIANSTPYFTDEIHHNVVKNWVGWFEQENGPQLRLQNTWEMLVHENLIHSAYGRYIYQNWSEVLGTTVGQSYIHIAKGMLEFDVRDKLDQINVPAEIIASDGDKLFSVALSEQMSQKIPNAHLSVLENAGHISNLDHPEAFTSVLLSFLKANY